MDFKRFFKSFRFASHGVATVFREEQNIKIFFGIMLFNIILAWILKLTLLEWTIGIVVTFFCLALEIMNIALEELLDMISPEYNGKAKVIKDVVAGSVFVSAIGAIIIALIIYLPHIL